MAKVESLSAPKIVKEFLYEGIFGGIAQNLKLLSQLEYVKVCLKDITFWSLAYLKPTVL